VKHIADIGAVATYAAGGGLAGLSVCLDHFFPGHAPDINSVAIGIVSVAGMVRVILNPTPTNSVEVTDVATGQTVSVRTVGAPQPPAQGPNPAA